MTVTVMHDALIKKEYMIVNVIMDIEGMDSTVLVCIFCSVSIGFSIDAK